MTKLHLAPMQGVADKIMREFLTDIGGIDQCVTEFIRITNLLLPESVYFKDCPELLTRSRTKIGTPVIVQLLGGDASCLAENAARACELGAYGIDLNFGCPAKTVNRHDGGAVLLKSPARIFKIVSAVRAAVPAEKKVSAKIRLGYDNPASCIELGQAIESAGASYLTVHCRTKADLYQAPAYWEWIPKIKENIKLPIVANGDIWNFQDLQNCQAITGCNEFMIGRGVLRDPFIFLKLRGLNPQGKSSKVQISNSDLDSTSDSTSDSNFTLQLLFRFFLINKIELNPLYAVARTKQWLRQIALSETTLQPCFDKLKLIVNPNEFEQALGAHSMASASASPL